MQKNEYLKLGKNFNIKVIWETNPYEYDINKIEELITIFSKRYNVPRKNIIIEPEYIVYDTEGNKSLFNNKEIIKISDPKFQVDLFEEYIINNKIEGIDFDEIIKIDNEINSKIDYDTFDKHRQYSIEWIEWSNFCSYGKDNFLDFTKLDGLVLLNGEPLNQSGKTTFAIDLLRFALYGSVGNKADTLSELFNAYLDDETKVEVKVCLNIDNKKYLIQRTLNRPKKRTLNSKTSQEVKYFEIINDNFDSLSPLEDYDPSNLKNEALEGRKTNQIIKEAIGKEVDYEMIISARADTLDQLISIKDTERGRLLSRWVGLLPLEEKDKIAREHYNKVISPSLITKQYNVDTLKREIEEFSYAIKDSENKIKEFTTKLSLLNKDIEINNKDKDILLTKKQTVDQNLLKLDINTINIKKADLMSNGVNLGKVEEELKMSFEELKDITLDEQLIIDIEKKIKNNEIKLAEYRIEIKTLTLNNNSLQNSKTCPTCNRDYDKDVILNINNNIDNNSKKISELTNLGLEVKKYNEELNLQLEKLINIKSKIETRSKIELRLTKVRYDLTVARNEYQQIVKLLDDYSKNKDIIDDNNEIEIKLNIIINNLKNQSIYKDTLISNIEFEKNKINTNNNSIKERNILLVKIENEGKLIKHWNLYMDMVGKNGITKVILRTVLPYINIELNRFLGDIADFTVTIEMNSKNEVGFYIIQNNIKRKLTSASGYELTLSALSLRTVLANVSTMPISSILVLDEILGTVAYDNLDKIKLLYDKISKYYKTIIHITHLENIKEWHKHFITVKKENNVSKLIVK